MPISFMFFGFLYSSKYVLEYLFFGTEKNIYLFWFFSLCLSYPIPKGRVSIEKMKEKNKQNGNNGKEENENNNTNNNENQNTESTNNLINKFGKTVSETVTDRKAKINIKKLEEIQNAIKQGEVIEVTNLEEFNKILGLEKNTDILTIRNKLYRMYQKGEISLKPVTRERTLYLVRK